MKIDGQCHCGAIAYSADVDPEKAAICHCTDCQCFSGAPFRASVPARIDDFRLLSGSPKIYVKIADSGARRAQAFCGECGAPIYASDARQADRPQLAPRRRHAAGRDPAAPADMVLLRRAVGARRPGPAVVARAVRAARPARRRSAEGLTPFAPTRAGPRRGRGSYRPCRCSTADRRAIATRRGRSG